MKVRILFTLAVYAALGACAQQSGGEEPTGGETVTEQIDDNDAAAASTVQGSSDNEVAVQAPSAAEPDVVQLDPPLEDYDPSGFYLVGDIALPGDGGEVSQQTYIQVYTLSFEGAKPDLKQQGQADSFIDGNFALYVNESTYSVIEYAVGGQGYLKAVVGPDFFEGARMTELSLTLDLSSTLAATLFERIVSEATTDNPLLRDKKLQTKNLKQLASDWLATDSSLSLSNLSSDDFRARLEAIYKELSASNDLLEKKSPNFAALLQKIAPKSVAVDVSGTSEEAEAEVEQQNDEPNMSSDVVEDGSMASEESAQDANPVSSALSGCYIRLTVCERKPERQGYFLDRKKGAADQESVCLKRAYEYHRWCKNEAQDVTIAEFHQDGYLLASARSDEPYDGCIVSMDTCQRKPDRVGWFIDNHQGSSSDQNRCLKRALEYHRWCKNSPDEIVTTSYYDDGTMLASITSQQPYDGCIIQQSTCRKHPDRIGLFLDNHKGASEDAKVCLKRAMDYRKWCGNEAEDVTSASFYQNGQLIQQVDSQTPYHGCMIQQSVCQRDESRTGLFVDNYQKSSSDVERCMARAMEYKNWCRNVSTDRTTASYYEYGAMLKTANSDKPYQGCHIEMELCAKHPDRQGLFLDTRRQASESKQACLRRALEYHKWCGNASEQTVKASYFEKATLIESISSQTPYHGCVIEQEACKRQPFKVGLFLDPYRESQTDASICLSRAQHFSKWCRNEAATTTAYFFENGKKLDSLTYAPTP